MSNNNKMTVAICLPHSLDWLTTANNSKERFRRSAIFVMGVSESRQYHELRKKDSHVANVPISLPLAICKISDGSDRLKLSSDVPRTSLNPAVSQNNVFPESEPYSTLQRS
jgi:hypothetical protein